MTSRTEILTDGNFNDRTGTGGWPPLSTRVHVPDVDATYRLAREAGVVSVGAGEVG